MKITELLLGIDLNMEDKLDLMLAKIMQLEKSINAMQETMEAHRVEHGFAKMQDGGVNSQFGDTQMGGGGYPQGGPMGGMPGMGGGMQMPGPGIGGPDPSRPPGM
jgi:hypothetical protein